MLAKSWLRLQRIKALEHHSHSDFPWHQESLCGLIFFTHLLPHLFIHACLYAFFQQTFDFPLQTLGHWATPLRSSLTPSENGLGGELGTRAQGRSGKKTLGNAWTYLAGLHYVGAVLQMGFQLAVLLVTLCAEPYPKHSGWTKKLLWPNEWEQDVSPTTRGRD